MRGKLPKQEDGHDADKQYNENWFPPALLALVRERRLGDADFGFKDLVQFCLNRVFVGFLMMDSCGFFVPACTWDSRRDKGQLAVYARDWQENRYGVEEVIDTH